MQQSQSIPLILLTALSVFLLSSCANYRLNYSKDSKAWKSRQLPPEKALSHTMFLIGDAGGLEPGDSSPALRLLRQKLAEAPDNSSVLFLGNNVSEGGMPPKKMEAERAKDEYRLRAQTAVLDDFAGRPVFLPGNQDWHTYGLEGIERQRQFLAQQLDMDEDDFWLPDPGCAGPEDIEITDNLVLFVIDSEWWLTDWEGETGINVGCEVKSREAFQALFEEEIKGEREKNVVIAMHHPLYSNGPRGGNFSLKQHLLPAPLLGSLPLIYRDKVGKAQDVTNAKFRELRDLIIASARKNGSFIFASGHEHSLQYIEKDGQHIIISGAGSRKSAAKTGSGVEFAYGHYGFARLNFYEDGAVWVEYWSTDDDGETGRVVFRKKIRGPLEMIVQEPGGDFPLYESGQDSIVVPVTERDLSRNGFGEWLWGEHYRKTYGAEIKVPILDLETFEGGLSPLEKGGGYQTNSLRFQTEDGRQYNIRSIDKDPTRTVPYPLNTSQLVLEAVKDGFSASHPFGALPLPQMLSAVSLYHTNPKVVYVPRQPGLESFNDEFGDALYLLEERPDEMFWNDKASFGYPKEIWSTDNTVEEIIESHDEIIDQKMIVRARIFDQMIGDWDRHDDQWRWSEIDSGGFTYYRPIPRDRDQAFSKYDGFLFFLARHSFPAARPLRAFDTDWNGPVQWSNFGPRHFDNTFLAGADWSVWEAQTRYIQEHLTDAIIERAFRTSLPEAVFRIDGPGLIRKTKARRDKLMSAARELYEFLAREVDVVGTENRDLFLVERLDDERTRVRVYDTNKEGERELLFFDRTFIRGETEAVTLYGHDDEDIFHITGEVDKGILLRVIGGLEEDVFRDESRVSGWGKKTIIYDAPDEERKVEIGSEAKLKLPENPKYNTYNRRASHYDFNYLITFPSFGFNPDDGFLVGAFADYTTYGFKKTPFASKHNLTGLFAFSTSGLRATYDGEFNDLLGSWELRLEAEGQTPLYAVNFYGFGNDTENPEDELGKDFNRVRQRLIAFRPSVMKRFNRASRLYFGPTFESISIERTSGRIVEEPGIAETLGEEVFGSQEFLGVRAAYEFRNVDDPIFPTNGLDFRADLGWKVNLDNTDRSFPYFEGALSIYQQVDSRGKLVLASRVGTRLLLSNEFEFYQGARLGGLGPESNIRGFRRDRFTGKRSFYQNIDLRWQALESGNRLLPFKLGFFGGFDHGRVWLDSELEDSDTWHYGFGGGIFIDPLDFVSIQISLFRGDNERNRIGFTGSFFF